MYDQLGYSPCGLIFLGFSWPSCKLSDHSFIYLSSPESSSSHIFFPVGCLLQANGALPAQPALALCNGGYPTAKASALVMRVSMVVFIVVVCKRLLLPLRYGDSGSDNVNPIRLYFDCHWFP